MKSRRTMSRLLSLLLAVVMTLGLMTPALADNSSTADTLVQLSAEKADADVIGVDSSAQVMQELDSPAAISVGDEEELTDEMIRVSIVLKDASTLEAGFEPVGIADNLSAMNYREQLQAEQSSVCASIEHQVLGGQELDVVWNLTLAANIISANVPRSAIAHIAAMPEVETVVEETRYEPHVVSVGGSYQPNTAVSGQMTGAQASWLKGYTGAGMRIAIIDTGLDLDHQSFDPDAFAYALEEDAQQSGRTYSLMTAADTADVLDKLNAYSKAGGNLTADQLYFNEKVPFGYNYVDLNLEITHDNDSQGEHGSHVAGISAANRYIERNGKYLDALESVHVAGAAPDAQLLVMKVFGANGGAYDADIFAGIEDAILLGADSVNLSLGSAAAGTARSSEDTYTRILNNLVDSDLVCVISAGNSSSWAEYTSYGALYSDGVNFDTVGAPGSYTNALTVASVDNDGMISAKLEIAGKAFVYSEQLTNAIGTPFGNASMTTLDTTADGSGTQYEFLLIDGLGKPEDYAGMDLSGKIVFCKRGEIDLVYKAQTAASLGAKAVVIYNYEPGLINMDLSGYGNTAPVVFVSDAAGALAKANGQKQTTADGLEYYTGSISVFGKETANYLQSEYLTVSSFSSWGVPGDLSLKPEISAPGGSIYSVNGGVAETDQYELMSGTSMAAPQVAGMAALVQQYLQENNISAEGITRRALTQALLMSTSVPMRSEAGSGNYYPLLQQGSGFANVNAAIQTPVYMTVDGMPDGKVKVELGEDAARTGKYDFTLRLHNLSDQELAYKLSGDLFTQDVYTEGGVDFLSANTRLLTPEIDFSVNGASVVEAEADLANCDFNGDGAINRSDAQALLDYVTGVRSELSHLDEADLSGDGQITTYDVHLMLKLYQGYVTVPAGGSVAVNVTIELSDADRETLSQQTYPTGAYLEAFIFAAAEAVEDGVVAPTLSVPVLGYYGSWTESSMYDLADNADLVETRIPYLGTYNANAVGVVYGDKPTAAYYFGGNPVTPDATYHPERNAINLERGDYFYAWKFSPVRNIAAMRACATNTTTGEPLMDTIYAGEVPAPYYYYQLQSWLESEQTLELLLRPDMEPGEHGELTLDAAPELYISEDGTVDWDALADGATKKVQFTIDNLAPELDETSVVVDTEANVLRLTAKDDQYLAGAILYDNTGRKILNRVAAPEDAQPGEAITLEIPLGNISGYRFVIQVGDYAANFTTYKLKQTIGTPGERPIRILFNTVSGKWFTTYAREGSYYWQSDILSAEATIMPYAAAAVGSYVYVTNDTGKLYVAPADDLDGLVYVCRLGYVLRDMAYDSEADLLYGVSEDGMLISIDKMDGRTQEIGYINGTAGFTKTLAFDGEKFYCITGKEDPSDYYAPYRLFSFTLDTVAKPEFVVDVSSYSDYSGEYQALAYDKSKNMVAWVTSTSGYYSYNDYYEFDLTAGTCARNSGPYIMNPSNCLFFPDWTVDDAWTEPDGTVTRIVFDRANVTVQAGYSVPLELQVLPWNLETASRSVSYSSLNPEISTVDANGVVTGVSVGTTTIRATSVSNPSVYADCTVTVEALDVTVDGVLMDDTGKPTMYTWDLAGGENTWQETVALDRNYYTKCITEIPGEDAFYLLTSTTGTMHKLSAENGTDLETPTSTYYEQNFPLYDMAYSSVYSTEDTNKVYAVRDSVLLFPFDPMNPGTSWRNENMNAIVVAIATGGTEKVSVTGYYGDVTEYDSEVVYVLDSSCRIHRLNFYDEVNSWWSTTTTRVVGSLTPTDLNVNIPEDSDFAGYSSLVVGSDGALYASIFDGSSSTLYRLVFDESIQRYTSTKIGNYGKDVWPAALLHVESNLPAVTAAPKANLRYNEETEQFEPMLPVQTEATGSLNALTVKQDSTAAESGIRIDSVAKTVTVPVLAGDSTNGLFELSYDESLLQLQSVSYGGVTLHSIAPQSGKLTIGYASETGYTGTVANLTFAYDVTETTGTELTFTLREDGASAVSSAEVFDLTLPYVHFISHQPIQGSAASGSKHFDDVKLGDWFYKDVMEIVNLGYMNGVSDTLFAPNGSLTRGMLVTILHRMEGTPAGGTNGFTDVPAGAYYTEAVAWAAKHEIVTGYGDGTFGPDDSITRQQLAAILWRYAQYKGMDVKANGTVLPDFPDRDFIASWAGQAISWAYSRGIMQGKDGGRLDPEGGATRAEAATMLNRFLTLVENTAGDVR